MKGEKVSSFEIGVCFTDNLEIRKINRKFLKHNYFTDVITFPYESGKGNLSGEIFVSLDTVKENAVIYKVHSRNELSRVLIHGCLHLAGYEDKTEKGKELIRKRENFYLGD